MSNHNDTEGASDAGGSRPPSHRRDLRASLLLGLVCLLVYNANLRSISAGDTYPARYLPFGIWRYGSVLLDPIADITAQGRPYRPTQPFWMVPGRGGHLIALYPVVLPVLVAPLYLPAAVYLHLRGWTEQRLDRSARIMEKLTASLLAAAATALLYLLLRRRAEPRIALLLTLAFAFGTTTWVISSQALWQHGLAELLVVGALLLVTGPCTARRALAAGTLIGLIACNRPPDAVLAAALGLYAWWWAGRLAPLLAAGAVLPAGMVLAYNLAAAGNVAGGYGVAGNATFFQHDMLYGLAGLLFSPTRGLFVFSPFLLFLPCFWQRTLHDRGARRLTLVLSAAVVLQVMLYAKADFRTGASWGPRWLTDLLPLLLWLLPPIVAALGGVGRAVFVLATCTAIAIQAVGAFWYTSASDVPIFAAVTDAARMRAAWDPHNAPFLAELRHPPAPRELLVEVSGNLDSIKTGGRDVEAVTAGQKIAVEGWALTGHRSPRQAEVLLDGQPAASTSHFFTRPDVVSARGEASPAGWRISLRTDGLAPGEHLLSAFAQISADGEQHYLAQRRFTVLAPAASGRPLARQDAAPPGAGRRLDYELTASVRRAAAALRERQQAAGYWLTSYTREPRFTDPGREMNTYLTAMLVDLLEPIGTAVGLGENLQRARRHLTAQIEAGGLVRYHGRPDEPTISTLGCTITPDADDTALVWRIAPSDRRTLLPAALATLARFRTGDGLYRTWLAARDGYQCIDPGKDPNPADAGIQMHVLLLLAQADPPAARTLCGALGRAIGEERIWVYYQAAPLVPILRQADLRRAGCSLSLPAARLRTKVPGQEVWVAACRLLQRFMSPRSPAPSPAETRALLWTLADGEFSYLRLSPPLLYHNDLTASTPRFYWSEDFGYALWLRLYHENAHRS
ncbi:MAG TPA: hypothetical protein VHG32_12110 [Thermoanaerobaculia bacterium]|nr:hypothetical protein [Thermoanaerobaculia bacterium]